MLSGFFQRIFKQVAQQLHGNILECQCRAMRQPQDMQPRLQGFERRDVVALKRIRAIGARDDIAQVIRGNIVGKP